MRTSIFPILSSLRDVDGVLGAFVISEDGALIDSDMPAMFAPSLFDDVGPRIVRLRETFASGGDEIDTCTIRFSDFKLYIRAMHRGFICILSSIGVNMPALKMGAHLAQRRILSELGSPDSSPVSSPPSSLAPPNWTTGAYGPASTTTPASSPPASSKAGLTYRGRPVR
jgi:predicted regulator of Ras-like GTPase activity (Roadblock/LC7/MglB family)